VLKIFDYPSPLWRVWSGLAAVLIFFSLFFWGPLLVLGGFLGWSRNTATFVGVGWHRFMMWVMRIRYVIGAKSTGNPAAPVLSFAITKASSTSPVHSSPFRETCA